MARTAALLEGGSRISDYVTLGVVARMFPAERVEASLNATGKASQRQRDLPAHVVVYYVIALALFSQASCREVLRCLLEVGDDTVWSASATTTPVHGVALNRAVS